MNTGIPFPPLSPEVFSISLFEMELALRWYALAYIGGILIGWRLAVLAVRRPALWPAGTPPVTAPQVEDLLTWVILGVIVGGRLGFALFYEPAYYLGQPLQILKIWQGGMSFHGGLIGVTVAALIYGLRNRVPLASMADMMALATPPGLLLGRLANFVNAELWGRPTQAPWGVIFPGEMAQACGQAVGALCARHPSQLYEAVLEGLILGALLLWLAFRGNALRQPGFLAGVFIAGYGTARFLVEFVRQPDAQFASPGNPLGLAWEVGGYGLTMGQILSLPMVLLGVALVVRARQRRG